MLSEREISAAIGTTAYGTDGDKLGTVEAFFTDDRTGAPTWVAITTGLFGTRHSIVPAVDATFAEGILRLPVTKDAVRHAPEAAGAGHLDPREETQLRRHYGLEDAGDGAAAWTQTATGLTPPGATDEEPGPATGQPAVPPAPVPAAPVPPAPVSPAPVPPAPVPPAPVPPAPVPPAQAPTMSDGAMTRSEEQLRVGTERVASTRARLVKYVVTEEVQITVPIRREEIRVEEVPLDAPDVPGESLLPPGRHAAEPPETGGLPGEIILHTERPVVTVEVVPSERVRLRTELVQGQETVSGQVQRERIAVDQEPVRPGEGPAGNLPHPGAGR